jgi:hypothetical protein
MITKQFEKLLFGQTPEEAQKEAQRPKVYTLKAGFEWNPLKRHRNIPCVCGSKKKAKRCHGQLETVPTEAANKIRAYLRALALAGFIRGRKEETSSPR